MAKSKQPRRKYQPGSVLVSPMVFGLSERATRDLSVKDWLAINGVITGQSVGRNARDDLSGVEMILVAQIYVVREAMRRQKMHRVDEDALQSTLTHLEQSISPMVHALSQRFDATGRAECRPEEVAALQSLGEIGDELRSAIPRRIITDGYRLAVYTPTIVLDVPSAGHAKTQ
jgi:hypothetical protein